MKNINDTKSNLESERIEIILLSKNQQEYFLYNPNMLEFLSFDETIDVQIKMAVDSFLHYNTKELYPWSSLWLIVLKDSGKYIGVFFFKGEPNDDGEVEIAYGIESQYQNRGYMTETLKLVCNWARNNKNIRTLFADTSNTISEQVLKKNGFTRNDRYNNRFVKNMDIM